MRQMILKLALPHPSSPTAPCVTISAGVAGVLPEADCEPAELIAAADAALYLAKQSGRNRALLSELSARKTAAVGRLAPVA
jgi:PleD family two-component response regulator